MRSLLFIVIVFIFGMAGLSFAAPDKGEENQDQGQAAATAEVDRDPSILDRYQSTGDTKSCISLTRISQSHVLSDTEIFFEMRGRRGYLSTLPHRCPSLDFYKSYTYKTGINQLCNTDIITVLLGGAREGASCGLGMFVEYERKPKD